MLPSVLAFFFVIVNSDTNWREAPGTYEYRTLEECKEGQHWYRMNEETGAFSECYAREVRTGGKE
jgi:hypothetical protein